MTSQDMPVLDLPPAPPAKTSHNVPIFLLGEAMGQNEVQIGKGFVGASGIELLRMLDEADVITLTSYDKRQISLYYDGAGPTAIDKIWRDHPELYRSNVFQLHPPGNKIEALCGPKAEAIPGYPALIKGKHIHKRYMPQLDRLADEILNVNPNLIVCLGNTALWAMYGQTGISKLRGTTCISTHCVADYKLLPTYHPAAVIRQWELRPTTVADLMKVKDEAKSGTIVRQDRSIWIEPELQDIERFFQDHVRPGSCIAVDIETVGDRITCIGFASGPSLALVIPFDDERKPNGSYWPDRDSERAVWQVIRRVLTNKEIKKVFQNGLYDISFIRRTTGIPVLGAEHDTMLLHHALQPESLKGLGYLGSIYANESAWKAERKGTKTIKRDE